MSDELKTPYHIFSEQKYEQNLKIFKRIEEEADNRCTFLMSFKGHIPHHSVELTNRYVNGFSVSSLNELRVCEEVFHSNNTHYYAPSLSEDDFAQLIRSKSIRHINFNAVDQVERFHKPDLAHIKYGIRVNPRHMIPDSPVFEGYNPNLPFGRFGVVKEELHKIDCSTFDTVHLHCLCNQGVEELSSLLDVLKRDFAELLRHCSYLNLGGGHSITSPGYNIPGLIVLIRQLAEEYNLHVLFEPSGSFFYDTGVLKTTVTSILKNEMDIAIVDTSAKNHMGCLMESPYFSVEIEGAEQGILEGRYSYRLGGCTCLAGDIIGDYSFPKKLELGDVLTITDQTAYTLMQTHRFNGVPKPALLVEDLKGGYSYHKSDGYGDYKRDLGIVEKYGKSNT